ncbi:hypothetical protein [Marivirga sp.]|uniref:hypothetical protein n=1 Tax=Marivirga sp. TaxID=2018662 RepID=UPI002D80D06D|nr:hypothetical protein [Marivirga sp.]HET8859358.1 hypothetical protein [Marivirga sp.]
MLLTNYPEFGFFYDDGFVLKERRDWPLDTYSKKAGKLFVRPLTKKDIDSLAAFTGSALIPSDDTIIIAEFPESRCF